MAKWMSSSQMPDGCMANNDDDTIFIIFILLVGLIFFDAFNL